MSIGDSLSELLNEKALQLVELDGKSITQLLGVYCNNSIVSLSIIPYIALYCRSAQDFLGEKIMNDEVDEKISDIRNGLKLYSGRYSKGVREVLRSDKHQDEIFRNRLRFSFMKNWNIHYNLGVFFDERNCIIGNSQQLNYFLNVPTVNLTIQQEIAFEMGEMLAENLANTLTAVSNMDIIQLWEEKGNVSVRLGYQDINTNRRNSFFAKTNKKEVNLLILHILSTINCVEHLFSKGVSCDDQWFMRIEYIVAHYAWQGLRKIKQHFDSSNSNLFSDDVSILLENGKKLFPSNFRNCMMHYDLCYDGVPAISKEYYNEKLKFFGLVESCFDGKSSSCFFDELRLYIQELETYLMSWFHVDPQKIKWDL